MAGASGAVRAGRAFVELLAKDTGLRAGLEKAGKQLEKWQKATTAAGKKMMEAGLAVFAPLAASTKVFAEMGDHLAKASARTGVAVEELSGLAYAAEQSGSDLEGLENGLRKMQKTLADAAQGSQGAKDAMQNLGLSLDDVKNLKPDEQFKLIADRLSQVKDPAAKAALAMEVFGKQGTSLIPLMAEGAAGIDELVGQAKRLGLVWSTEDAKAAEEFGDRLDDLWKVMKKATADVGAALVPIFRELAVVVTENVVKVSAWIRTHRETVQLALKVAAGVTAAGAAFYGLGKGMGVLSSVVGGLGGALGTIAKIASTVLFSGLGLAGIAVVGLGAYLLATTDKGRQAMTALGGYFSELGQIAGETMGAVTDAIKAGRWDLAVSALMAGVQAEWYAGILPLQQGWDQFRALLTKTGANAFDGFLAAWEITRNFLTESWLKVTGFFGSAWNTAVAGVANIWDTLQSTLEKGWLKLMNMLGQLSDAEYDAAVKQADAQHRFNVDANDRERDQKNAAAAQKLRAELAAEKARSDAALAGIGQRNLDTGAAVDAELRRKTEEARQRAAAARAALDKARAAVPNTADNLFGLPLTPEGWAKMLTDRARAAGDGIAGGLDGLMKRTTVVQGTFNSAALNALGGTGDVPRQQLDQLKQINKNTKNAPKGGVSFS